MQNLSGFTATTALLCFLATERIWPACRLDLLPYSRKWSIMSFAAVFLPTIQDLPFPERWQFTPSAASSFILSRCVYVCVCVCLWVCMCVCVCLLRAGSLLTLTESQPHPPPHCPPPPKAPIFSAHLRKSWCSHNSGLNECCSRRVLLLLLLTELHVLTILSADEWSGAGGRRWRQEGVG